MSNGSNSSAKKSSALIINTRTCVAPRKIAASRIDRAERRFFSTKVTHRRRVKPLPAPKPRYRQKIQTTQTIQALPQTIEQGFPHPVTAGTQGRATNKVEFSTPPIAANNTQRSGRPTRHNRPLFHQQLASFISRQRCRIFPNNVGTALFLPFLRFAKILRREPKPTWHPELCYCRNIAQ